ncbi:hypothetical protein [Naasia sp. SYSU D00948]|uniref:hypothetical protein n=1 Tax=Naasia sp. SYSU D00948 TaxID=2817379 RepID=UPI001B3183EE|nr:hypothetical protein [Naasia sp. SYSU D00948]
MTTTIKVTDELRDRLKAQAAQAGRTLGAHLAALADMEERRQRLAAVKAALARTSDEDAASHSAETREWETTELSDARE